MGETTVTYLCRFDADGRRGETRLACEYTEEQKEAMITDGFVEITQEEWEYYVGNKGMGDNGTGYIRVDGKPVSAPVHIPTKSEKLAQLENEYEQESAELEKYYNKANIKNNTDLMAELSEGMTDLEAEYEAKRKEILEG